MRVATKPSTAILVAAGLLASLALACQAGDPQTAPTASSPPVSSAPTASRPPVSTEPTARTGEWAAAWMERHEELNRRLEAGAVDVAFIGDSITHFWEPSQFWEDHGQSVWEEYFGDFKAVNLGVSGDQTGHLLWRVENSDWAAAAPKVAVIMIGTNNLSSAHTPAEIAAGNEIVVKRLRELSPTTRILLLGVFPREERPGELRAVLKETNRLLAQRPWGEMVEFMDLWDDFLDQEGRISPQVMPDFLHLGAEGYVIWAQAVDDKLDEMLAAAAAEASRP